MIAVSLHPERAPFITVMTSVTSTTIPLTWTSAGSIVNKSGNIMVESVLM